jgi:hypothetical protein
MTEDSYRTIAGAAAAVYTEKLSRFIAVALPVRSTEEV